MDKKITYHFSADIIRTFAIICVVVIHVTSEFVNTPPLFGNGTWWLANVLDAVSRVAVPLFVMLSGMLLLHSDKTYGAMQFFKKRFSKIGVPLIIWPLIYYLWDGIIKSEWLDVLTFIKHFVNMTIYYHLYFLYLIAGLYLLTPIIKVYISHASDANKRYALSLCALFAISVTTTKYFFDTGPNLGTIFTIAIPYIGYYLAGDYLRHLQLTKKQFSLIWLGYTGMTVLTAVLNLWYMHFVHWSTTTNLATGNWNRWFYDYTSFTVISMSLLSFVAFLNVPKLYPHLENSWLKKPIISISQASFGIYLIHPLFLDILNRYTVFHITKIPSPMWVFMLIKILILFITSYMVMVLLRKFSYLRFLLG